MRFLLVNPFVTDFACYDYWMRPLGLLYLSSILKYNGHSVRLLDCMDRSHPSAVTSAAATGAGRGRYVSNPCEKPPVLSAYPRNFRKYGISGRALGDSLDILKGFRPDMVFLSSGMTYWYQGVVETACRIRETFPGVPVVLGGTYASLCPEHAEKNVPADLIVSRGGLRAITGITGVPVPPFREWPAPDHSEYRKGTYAVIRTSRGCPNSCPYCGIKLISPAFESKSARVIKNETELLYKSGFSEIVYYDDALLSSVEFIKYLENPVKGPVYHTPNGLEAGKITLTVAKALRNAGFADPCISADIISSGADDTSYGATSEEDVAGAAGALLKAGYRKGEFSAYLLAGCPGQRFDSVISQAELLHSLGARVRLAEYAVVPGTRYSSCFNSDVINEPLLHNNSVYPSLDVEEWDGFFQVKRQVTGLNRELGKGGS